MTGCDALRSIASFIPGTRGQSPAGNGGVASLPRLWHSSPVLLPSIAVLPLENLSNDPAQDYFVDGMTDEIITDLARLAGPKVISHTSVVQYMGTRKTIPEIAGELQVGAILEGSVERAGDRMRVRVQLIGASSDQHLWAEAYDRQVI